MPGTDTWRAPPSVVDTQRFLAHGCVRVSIGAATRYDSSGCRHRRRGAGSTDPDVPHEGGGQTRARGCRRRYGLRGLPAAARPAQPIAERRRSLLRLPDLLQSKKARRGSASQGRRDRRHRANVGMDRRRGRHHFQLLVSLRHHPGGSDQARLICPSSLPSATPPAAVGSPSRAHSGNPSSSLAAVRPRPCSIRTASSA